VITRWEAGLLFSESNYNRIVDNVVWVTTNSAFGISNGAYNHVRRNTFITDLSYVVYFHGFNDSTFVDNRVVSQTGWVPAVGAEMENSSRNLIARNEFAAVPQGLRLHSGSSNLIRDNLLTGVPMSPGRRAADWPDPVPDGLAILAPATGTRLTGNTARGFDDDGIDVDAPGTRLKGNSATGNGDLGIEAVPGVIDQGGNTAGGNGNPLQCTNVFCS
jgi:hypothetical protein